MYARIHSTRRRGSASTHRHPLIIPLSSPNRAWFEWASFLRPAWFRLQHERARPWKRAKMHCAACGIVLANFVACVVRLSTDRLNWGFVRARRELEHAYIYIYKGR